MAVTDAARAIPDPETRQRFERTAALYLARAGARVEGTRPQAPTGGAEVKP
mgnify:CR=1 FL=1